MSSSSAPGDQLRDAIAASSEVVLVAPYMKEEPLETLLNQANRGVRLSCVTRWQPGDIEAGISDIACRALVHARGGSFRLHPTLHAKYFRFDSVVLVGSANVTAAAFGWATHSNLEILCHAGSDFDHAAFEKAVLKESRDVTDEEITYWQDLMIAIDTDPALRMRETRIADWSPATRDPNNLLRACRGENEEIASLDDRAAANHDLHVLGLRGGESDQQIRMRAATSLLSSSFTADVLRVQRLPREHAVQRIGEIYDWRSADARRSLETTESWLAFLVPETLLAASRTDSNAAS